MSGSDSELTVSPASPLTPSRGVTSGETTMASPEESAEPDKASLASDPISASVSPGGGVGGVLASDVDSGAEGITSLSMDARSGLPLSAACAPTGRTITS